MAVQLGILFPSEPEALRRHLRNEQHLTPTQRMHAVADLYALVKTLSQAGGQWERQLKSQSRKEQDWQRHMKEFIAKHVEPRDDV